MQTDLLQPEISRSRRQLREPNHIPRERVVIDPSTTCECCGSNRLRKLGDGRHRMDTKDTPDEGKNRGHG
jgi:hypothetical protein